MDCRHCQYLESELARLEEAHAEAWDTLRAATGTTTAVTQGAATGSEYQRLRKAERIAKLHALDGRIDLVRHKQKTHPASDPADLPPRMEPAAELETDLIRLGTGALRAVTSPRNVRNRAVSTALSLRT